MIRVNGKLQISLLQKASPSLRLLAKTKLILCQALPVRRKSNSAYMAIIEAQNMVSKTGDLPVPLHIRNAPTKLMKSTKRESMVF